MVMVRVRALGLHEVIRDHTRTSLLSLRITNKQIWVELLCLSRRDEGGGNVSEVRCYFSSPEHQQTSGKCAAGKGCRHQRSFSEIWGTPVSIEDSLHSILRFLKRFFWHVFKVTCSLQKVADKRLSFRHLSVKHKYSLFRYTSRLNAFYIFPQTFQLLQSKHCFCQRLCFRQHINKF